MCNQHNGEPSQMNCPRKTLGLVAAVLLALPLTVLPRQQFPPPPPPKTAVQPGQPAPQGQTIVIRSTEVVVPVTVKDVNGQLVNDLGIADFRLLEDNIEQNIRLTVDPFPLSIVVLFDAALKTNNEKQVQESIKAIAAGISDNDEAAIFRFADYPYQITDFISGSDNLLTQLQRVQISTSSPMRPDYSATTPTVPKVNGGQVPGPSTMPGMDIRILGNGTKSVNDALYAAAELLRTREHNRRKIIFLISDGVDSKRNNYNFEVTVQALVKADASVYSIGIGTPIADRLTSIIRRFAKASGGDIFWASNKKDLENLYPSVAEQARNQYTLIYQPAHDQRDITYHSIDVRVKRPGLQVLARDGYYSAPPR